MRALALLFIRVCALFAFMALPALAGELDRMEHAPKGWRGDVFHANYRFPRAAPTKVRPWQTINFRKEPRAYMNALLVYALEGQDLAHWRVQNNRVRRWCHVPWMGPGGSGREFIHGLTRGRDLAPGELGAAQTKCRQTWSIAFYNPEGGAILGRIWRPVIKNTGAPDVMALPFPIGTVAVKLVFTQADTGDTPALSGAPEIEANIVDGGDLSCPASIDAETGKPAKRTPQRLRLMQLDIAVREERATYKTGWVFMSFVYDGGKPGNDPWAKLEPIGLMWGNDPQLSDDDAANGMKPRQGIVFAAQTFGRGGRMNGPADERNSACSSCHMAAQWPTVAPMTAPSPWSEAKCWFRNLDARYAFGLAQSVENVCSDMPKTSVVVPLDFSLQLTTALRNWSLAHASAKPRATNLGRIEKNAAGALLVNGIESLPLRR